MFAHNNHNLNRNQLHNPYNKPKYVVEITHNQRCLGKSKNQNIKLSR